jgi:predicted GH43/DUF377 family glycosyl hydrolase
VLSPDGGAHEARGIEDLRVIEIDGEFYMAHTAFARSPVGDFQVQPMFAAVTTSSEERLALGSNG